jgi:hypothetical protein
MTSEIHIWKSRFSWVGKQGKAELDFDVMTSTYKQHVHDPFLHGPAPAKPVSYADDDDDDYPF